MEFTVKAVDANVEEKSRAQVEETLLKKHEEQFEDTADKPVDDGIDRVNFSSQETKVEDTPVEETEVKLEENDVLLYIKNRYNGRYWHVLPKDMSRFWKQYFKNGEK